MQYFDDEFGFDLLKDFLKLSDFFDENFMFICLQNGEWDKDYLSGYSIREFLTQICSDKIKSNLENKDKMYFFISILNIFTYWKNFHINCEDFCNLLFNELSEEDIIFICDGFSLHSCKEFRYGILDFIKEQQFALSILNKRLTQ